MTPTGKLKFDGGDKLEFIRESLITLRYTLQTLVPSGTKAQRIGNYGNRVMVILTGGELDGQMCTVNSDDLVEVGSLV